VADGVDAAMQLMEPSRSKPVLDSAATDPKRPQLAVRHNTMLGFSEIRNDLVHTTRRQKPMHGMGK
jgi:hypothetical protein